MFAKGRHNCLLVSPILEELEAFTATVMNPDGREMDPIVLPVRRVSSNVSRPVASSFLNITV
jgi:hypothetical protein